MKPRIREGVRAFFRLPLRHADLAADEADAELQMHLELRIEQLMARGLTADEARAEAVRLLGKNVADVRSRLQESSRRRERKLWLRELTHGVVMDLRYAARGLVQRPGFTLMTLAMLAIGLGATTAIYSAVHALLLRPLPFVEPERLMHLSLEAPPEGDRSAREVSWSYAKYQAFREAQREFASHGLHTPGTFTITEGEAERVMGEAVSASYLPTLGIQLARGRNFLEAETAHAGSVRLVILSDAVWQRRFHADPGVIGRTLQINGNAFEIVGVAAGRLSRVERTG